MPELFVDGRGFMVYENYIFPTNPGQKLRVAGVTDCSDIFHEAKYISIFIDKNKMQELAGSIFGVTELVFRNENNPLNHDLLEYIRIFCTECMNRQAGYELLLNSIVTQISVSLIRQLRSNIPAKPGNKIYATRNEVKHVMDYFWENTNVKFSLRELCKIANLSPYYFIRLFKNTTGQTPYECFMDIKVMRALEYLKDKKYTLTEISYMLGFSSHSHFTAIFRKKMGITPSEYIRLS